MFNPQNLEDLEKLNKEKELKEKIKLIQFLKFIVEDSKILFKIIALKQIEEVHQYKKNIY